MAEEVKNIGVIAASYTGATAPTNRDLIWIDSSTPQRVKKLYNPTTGVWEPHVTGVPSLEEDLVIIGTNLGALESGTTIPAGTSLESVLKQAGSKIVAPTYSQPAISFTVAPYAAKVEAGTNINHTLSSVFTQNDAGAPVNVEFEKEGAVINTDTEAPFSYVEPQFQIGDETISYKATVNYSEGATKNNNMGTPDPTGKILAGSKDSVTRTIEGCRKAFYGVDQDLTSDGANARLLSGNVLDPANGSTFTITIPAGASKVQFAYPSTLRAVNSVKYTEGLNAEIKSIFSETALNVPGANSFTAIGYRVYEYVPAAPFESEAHYVVTI